MVIRTELDWGPDIYPVDVSSDGSTATFEIMARQPFVDFKPCLIKNGSLHWAVGTNNLLTLAGEDDRIVYPYFFSDSRGQFLPLVPIESAILGRGHRLRAYLPPGYDENTLARYPIAYMQDGQNLFFPKEAFRQEDWKVDQTSHVLRAMQAIEDLIIVGVYSDERREEEYTRSLRRTRLRQWRRLLFNQTNQCGRIRDGNPCSGVANCHSKQPSQKMHKDSQLTRSNFGPLLRTNKCKRKQNAPRVAI